MDITDFVKELKLRDGSPLYQHKCTLCKEYADKLFVLKVSNLNVYRPDRILFYYCCDHCKEPNFFDNEIGYEVITEIALYHCLSDGDDDEDSDQKSNNQHSEQKV